MIKFIVKTPKNVQFPLHLRIPGWCEAANVKVNGVVIEDNATGIVVVDRKWKDGDVVELLLPMELRFSRWFEVSLGIERGPLVYALRVEEEWKQKRAEPKNWRIPNPYYEVYPKSPWNFGITSEALKGKDFNVEIVDKVASYPWNLENSPIAIKTKGKKIDSWGIYNGSASKVPRSPVWFLEDVLEEEITLIPYGCTTLRISQFPVIGGNWDW